jgi:hypothetical protein
MHVRRDMWRMLTSRKVVMMMSSRSRSRSRTRVKGRRVKVLCGIEVMAGREIMMTLLQMRMISMNDN